MPTPKKSTKPTKQTKQPKSNGYKKTKKSTTIYAFLDNENINISTKKQWWKIDWKKFREMLRDKFGVTRAFQFMGYIKTYEPMYEYFRECGYEIIFKPVATYGNDTHKGNVDTDLVLHTMIEYPNYDKAVIVTGDGDFASLVEYLKKQKKLKQLIVPNQHRYSKFLDDAVPKSKITALNQYEEALTYYKEEEEVDESFDDNFYS